MGIHITTATVSHPVPLQNIQTWNNFSPVIEAWPLVQFGELHGKIDEKIHEKIEA